MIPDWCLTTQESETSTVLHQPLMSVHAISLNCLEEDK